MPGHDQGGWILSGHPACLRSAMWQKHAGGRGRGLTGAAFPASCLRCTGWWYPGMRSRGWSKTSAFRSPGWTATRHPASSHRWTVGTCSMWKHRMSNDIRCCSFKRKTGATLNERIQYPNISDSSRNIISQFGWDFKWGLYAEFISRHQILRSKKDSLKC